MIHQIHCHTPCHGIEEHRTCKVCDNKVMIKTDLKMLMKE